MNTIKINFKYCFVVFIALIIFNKCSNKDEYYEGTFKINKKIDEFENIKSWDIKSKCKQTFLLPPDIYIINDKYIFIVNVNKKKLIEVYDINSNNIVVSFGEKGSGPGEYQSIPDIFSDPYNDNLFYIYDTKLCKVDLYELDLLLNKEKYTPKNSTKISIEAGRPIRLNIMSNNNFIANGIFFNSRLCSYNLNGRIQNKIDILPSDISGISKNEYIESFYHTNIVVNNSKNKFAMANFNSDILFIYSNSKLEHSIHGPDFITPKFLSNKSKNNRNFGYFDLAKSSDYIYCSYSGTSIKPDTKNWMEMMPNNILIFDWEGTPISQVNFNKKIGKIAYSNLFNTLYFIYFDGEYFKLGYHKIT